MSIKNAISNHKYFKVLEYGTLTGILQSIHDYQIFGNSGDSKILEYIRNQSLSRDLYYDVYKEVHSKSFLHTKGGSWENIMCNIFVNVLNIGIGTFMYSNMTTNHLLLGVFGGAISLQLHKIFNKDVSCTDLVFGVFATIQAINIAQNMLHDTVTREAINDNFDDIYHILTSINEI